MDLFSLLCYSIARILDFTYQIPHQNLSYIGSECGLPSLVIIELIVLFLKPFLKHLDFFHPIPSKCHHLECIMPRSTVASCQRAHATLGRQLELLYLEQSWLKSRQFLLVKQLVLLLTLAPSSSSFIFLHPKYPATLAPNHYALSPYCLLLAPLVPNFPDFLLRLEFPCAMLFPFLTAVHTDASFCFLTMTMGLTHSLLSTSLMYFASNILSIFAFYLFLIIGIHPVTSMFLWSSTIDKFNMVMP